MKVFVAAQFVAEYRGAEFPPSPLKLVQAIIASSQDTYMDVLNCLETQTPHIRATTLSAQYEYSRFVINNDERLEHVNAAGRKEDIVRHFPEAPAHVVYEYDVPAELLPRMTEAISKVHTLGRAGDWVFASVSDTLPAGKFDVYRPEDGGLTTLRVPVEGSVASLFAHYHYKVPVIFKDVAYAKNPPSLQPRVLFTLTEPVPAQQTSHVVAWIRHAAMKAGIPGIDGHDNNAPRLTITPLPTIDFRDGMIRRVVVSSPDTSLVKIAASKMAALRLVDVQGEDRGYLMPADIDAVFSDYLNASKRWVTVTPVLQSGFHNGDPKKRAKVYAKMFKHAGLPMPISVCETKLKTEDYKVGEKHGHHKLPRVGLVVEFAEPVAGPVSLGSGRYTGLGIFANLSRQSAVRGFA
jgi:CRISPR-associated protein Csb2